MFPYRLLASYINYHKATSDSMNVIFPILFIVAILVLQIILKRLIPSKGAIGEKRVARILKQLPEEKYSVINNLLLNNSGYTSQVDHVVVSSEFCSTLY